MTLNALRMSRIEMVMHLQSVDLFRSCAATEAVRLAQIAEVVQFAKGDVIYRPSEPAGTLYIVVEGKVSVRGVDGYHREPGPRGSFGVFEVLSGRQRSHLAEATTKTLALAIEGEDFFDLLSNNIDIVKALFREVLAESGWFPPTQPRGADSETGLHVGNGRLDGAQSIGGHPSHNLGIASEDQARERGDQEPEGAIGTRLRLGGGSR